MIRDRNIAKDANIQLTKILGAHFAGKIPTGEIFWVGDDGDAAFESMAVRVAGDRLYTDLDTCVGKCTANRGDIIVMLEGTNQTVSAAAGLVLDIAGLTIVFLGSGTSQAKITFDTATTADMDVDAADITLIRPKFVAGIDALAGPIDINSTDFTIIDGEWHDATDIETKDCIIATAGATRLKIDGWKFFKANENGTQKESHIQLNGVDDAILRNIYIDGDFDTGCIENVTDECLRITLENLFIKNTDPGNGPAMVLDSACSGWATNVHLRNANGTVVSDNSDINWGANCLGFSTDGAAGDPIGTAAASGVEGKVDVIDGYHDVPTADTSDNVVMRDVVGNKDDAAAAGAVTTAESLMAYIKQVVGAVIVENNSIDSLTKDHPNYLTVVADMTSATWNSSAAGGHEIATVTGLVRVRIVPEITAGLGSGGAAVISLGTETTKDGFIGATTCTELDTDEIWFYTTSADNVKFVDPAGIPDFIVNGDDIGYLIATTSTTAGSITFHIWWEPLETGATVAAGAGGTL